MRNKSINYTIQYVNTFARPLTGDDEGGELLLKGSAGGVVGKVPLDARGRPDWGAVPVGHRVWASIQHPTDAADGRMVLLHRGEHGFVLVDDEHGDNKGDHLASLDAPDEVVAKRRMLLARDEEDRDYKRADTEAKRANRDPLGPLGLLVPRHEATVRVTSPWEGDEIIERPGVDKVLGLEKSTRSDDDGVSAGSREGRDRNGSDGWMFNEDDSGEDREFWARFRQEMNGAGGE